MMNSVFFIRFSFSDYEMNGNSNGESNTYRYLTPGLSQPSVSQSLVTSSNDFFNTFNTFSTTNHTPSTDSTLLDNHQYRFSNASSPYMSISASTQQWEFPSTSENGSCSTDSVTIFPYESYNTSHSTEFLNEVTTHNGLTLPALGADSSQAPESSSVYQQLSLDSLSKEYKNLLKNIPRKSKEGTISASDQAAFRTCHPRYSRKALRRNSHSQTPIARQ